MEAVTHEPIMTRFPGKDPQWDTSKYRFRCINSLAGHGAMKISDNGKITASGLSDCKDGLFRIYQGISNDKPVVMFECIGGDSDKFMICVDDKGNLTTQKRIIDYININQAKDDVLFEVERVSQKDSTLRFKSRRFHGYLGFDQKGGPVNVKDVKPDSDEAKFLSIKA